MEGLCRRLSLSLGVRWDYEQFPDPQLPNSLLPQTSTLNENKKAKSLRALALLMTRGAIARRSCAAYFGMFYARAINSTLYQALIGTGAAGSQTNPNLYPRGGVLRLPEGRGFHRIKAACLGSAGGNATAYFLDPNFKVPQILQADLTVQQQISNNDAFSISWLGSCGSRLPDFVDTNLPTPIGRHYGRDPTQGGPLPDGIPSRPMLLCKRPNPNFSSITNIFSGVNSNYQALVAQYTHRFSHNVS